MTEYTGPERRGNGGWHMSKSLSVSHLLGTLAIAVGFFTYVTGIEQDTIRNQLEIKSLYERMDRSDTRNSIRANPPQVIEYSLISFFVKEVWCISRYPIISI